MINVQEHPRNKLILSDLKGMEYVPNIFISFDKYLLLEVINILI